MQKQRRPGQSTNDIAKTNDICQGHGLPPELFGKFSSIELLSSLVAHVPDKLATSAKICS